MTDAPTTRADHAELAVAWRVKDFADGWIVCGSEQTAIDLAVAMSGATIQPLFGPALLSEIAALRGERDRLRTAVSKSNDEICQSLGKALGYPWFKDDQANFPGSTESDGVCVGDHVAESIADEAARRLTQAERQRDEAVGLLREWHPATSEAYRDHSLEARTEAFLANQGAGQ